MPVPAIIASAANNYRFNSDFLVKTVEDLSPEEWLKSPAANTDHAAMNHTAWIVGHLLTSRKRLLDRIEAAWSYQPLEIFARGSSLLDAAAYPAPDALLNAWHESATALAAALDNVSDEVLAKPAPPGPPSPDGKLSGNVNFLVIHETYHIGQAAYLRKWLGHTGLMG